MSGTLTLRSKKCARYRCPSAVPSTPKKTAAAGESLPIQHIAHRVVSGSPGDAVLASDVERELHGVVVVTREHVLAADLPRALERHEPVAVIATTSATGP